MRHRVKLIPFASFALVVLGAIATTHAAEETWAGKISDSMCKFEHAEDPDAAAGGGGKTGAPEERECTLACVRGGSKFVFVSNGKLYQISNQQLAALSTHAGHEVKLTGELKDDIITVSRIEMP
jgi:hypothetical protein